MFPTEYQRHSIATSTFAYIIMIWLVSFAVSSTLFMEKSLDEDGFCWTKNPQYLVAFYLWFLLLFIYHLLVYDKWFINTCIVQQLWKRLDFFLMIIDNSYRWWNDNVHWYLITSAIFPCFENFQISFQVLSSLLSFFIPGAIVVYLYIKIFRKLRSHRLYIFGQLGLLKRQQNNPSGRKNDEVQCLPRVTIEEVHY